MHRTLTAASPSRSTRHREHHRRRRYALIRSVGDKIDGVVVGRCHIDGDAEIPHAPVEVTVTASLFWGLRAQELSRILRNRVHDALRKHTELNVTAINIVIDELHGPFPDPKATT